MKLSLLLAVLATTSTWLNAQTFGPQQSSDPGNASITFNSATGSFTYTDGSTPNDDSSFLPLTGSSAAFITGNSSWTSSLNVSLGADTLTSTGTETPQFGMALGITATVGGDTYQASINLAQDNNTGSTSNSDVPNNAYGTLAEFEVDKNGIPQQTMALNGASSYAGTSYRQISGGTNGDAATEPIGAATGVLGLSFNSLTDILTGTYDGTALGSVSLAPLGASPTLTLGVAGFSGEGVAVTSGLATANSFSAAPEPSTLPMLLGGLGTLIFSGVARRGLRAQA